MKNLFHLLCFLLLATASAMPQDLPPELSGLDSSIARTTRSRSDNRFRITGGLFRVTPEDQNFFLRHAFVNINYRSSVIDPKDNPLLSDPIFTSEIGLNYFLPYFKVGFELRFLGSVFIDTHTGLQLIFWDKIAPIPFIGFCGGYIFEIQKGFRIEFETGYNLPVFPLDGIQYITIGIALK